MANLSCCFCSIDILLCWSEIAYMAVTNLVQDQPDHAKRIAEFSVDAITAANETLVDLEDPEKGFVNIRVGETNLLSGLRTKLSFSHISRLS